MSERYLRARDVAELLDVSVETVLRWHRSGKLPGGYRLASNVLRFSESKLETWLQDRAECSLLTGDSIPGYSPGHTTREGRKCK